MTNAHTSKTAIVYRSPEGNKLFADWLNSLHDPTKRRRIRKRLLKEYKSHA